MATAWNSMSFGLAESAGGIQDSYQADEISGRQALAQAAAATGGAVKDAAQTYAGGALKGLGAAGKALNGVARGSDALDTAEGLVATGRELAAGNADGLKGKVLGAAAGAGLGKLAAKKPTGSYTNTHESGKKYHGKGTEDRMNTSAKEKAAEHGDPVVEQDFKSAANRREAFKDEARRIREDGGVENPNNYNKINSPGEKYLKQDDE